MQEHDVKCVRNDATYEQLCEGDVGSPVVRENKLVGIVAGFLSAQISLPKERKCGPITPEERDQLSCNDQKTVSIYTSVVDHKQWIQQSLKKSRVDFRLIKKVSN